MPRYGHMLFTELRDGARLVDQAQAAEEAGFEFAPISDHYHPWISEHSDAPLAWTVLGGLATATGRIELATMVTCPFVRYHPAIVAQGAATVAQMSGGRFVLGLGAGERLNEHVVGAGWPPIDVRHELLVESVEAMRRLWSGEFTTYRGRHVTVEDAKLYTLPDAPPPVLIAAGGPQAVQLAVEHGDGLIVDSPDAEAIRMYRDAGGRGPVRGLVPLAYDRDEKRAVEYAQRFKFGLLGWKVMSELPNPVNFDAATAYLRREDVTQMVPAGPDPKPHIDAITGAVDAGIDEIAVVPVGDDHDGFIRWWTDEVRPALP